MNSVFHFLKSEIEVVKYRNSIQNTAKNARDKKFVVFKQKRGEDMTDEEITDETAIEHFKKRVSEKISKEEQERIDIVVEKEVYPFKEVLKHMEAKDEIGKREIEVEKAYMRWLKEKGKE